MSEPLDLFAWLKAPSTPSGAKNVLIVIGPDANLTPELQQQLEQLAKSLQTKTGVNPDPNMSLALNMSPDLTVSPDLKCEQVSIGTCKTFYVCQGVETSG
jgi:hypothetical protein